MWFNASVISKTNKQDGLLTSTKHHVARYSSPNPANAQEIYSIKGKRARISRHVAVDTSNTLRELTVRGAEVRCVAIQERARAMPFLERRVQLRELEKGQSALACESSGSRVGR